MKIVLEHLLNALLNAVVIILARVISKFVRGEPVAC